MKSFKKFFVIISVILLLFIITVNVILFSNNNKTVERPYIVEIHRLSEQMNEYANSSGDNLLEVIDLDDCKYVKKVILCEDEAMLTTASANDYCIRKIHGKLYRFEYSQGTNFEKVIILVNVFMAGISIMVLLVLVFVGKRIIYPFKKLEEVPYELAKGNLALELPEERTKFFGKFIWGTNMLRESLEQKRLKELELHKEKKLLLLSLTHDIKTPLSVIKLNCQALEKKLYKDEERRAAAVHDILIKADEIEHYVTDIVSASREDFLDLSVVEEEFYLSDVISKIEQYYCNKLHLQKIEFIVDDYKNCLILGDRARLEEVLQNLMENAIKYGDGNQIRLSFDREQECILISVRNTGGMKSEEIANVFDSFYRGSNVGSKPGSGLGLYICRQLMTNMNGDIFVKQEKNEFFATVVVRMN